MAGFVEGIGREQSMLFPARLDDYVAEDNPVRAVDFFVDGLDICGIRCHADTHSTARRTGFR
jgi:hypothetical protein